MDRVIELTKKLISIPSVSGNEQAISEFVADELRSTTDLDVIIDVPTGKGEYGPNIVAKYIYGRSYPTIILNAHLDTVAPVRGWTRDPYEPVIENNKLYGLGAADMKAGLAIIINVFEQVVASGGTDGINLIFTAVSGEEGTSKGTYTLLTAAEPVNGDLCLISEPTLEKVMLGCRGRYQVDIELYGVSGHGARPEQGVNAIEDAAKIITNLHQLKLRTHAKLGKGSVCPLGINGRSNFLSVPEFCKMSIDRHVVFGETQEVVLRDFDKLLSTLNIRSTYKLSFTPRETPYLEPYLTDPAHPLVQVFIDSYRTFYGKPAEIMYGKSVGDYNLFGQKMQTVVYGPIGERFHSADEFVYIDSIIRCRNFYLSVLLGFNRM
jgi:acetylornithine deacetylase/succinyl-diaminopimelate desuccinylase-like protein